MVRSSRVFRTLALCLACPLAARELVPLAAFFDSQAVQQMALSPDGNKIAMIAPNQGRYSIALLDTLTGKLSVPVHFTDENIRSLFWKGDDRILFYSAIGGHEIPLLASAEPTGRAVRRLLEPRRNKDEMSLSFGTLVDRFPASDDHILIVGYTAESDPRRLRDGIPQNVTPYVYKVNVETGRRTPLTPAEMDADSSFFDSEGNLRLIVTIEGREAAVKTRARGDRPWRTLRTFPAMDVRWAPQTLLADNRTLYLVDGTDEGRGGLRPLDLETGKLGDVVFAPAAGEILSVIVAPGRKRLLGVVYEDEKLHTHWLDAQWAKLGRTLDAQFPRHAVNVVSISRDEKRFIFLASSDRDPGTYYLGDLRGDGLRAQPLSGVRPAIKPDAMSPMEPIQFPARDGLVLHGYLTKPGGVANARTPLLVMPHGGPFGVRDSWGFSNEVQFLANRGYAVLQVNFRGSRGYGADFMQAGFREWGGKMQDDLTDGVKWVLAQGWADPARVGIIGASYGGYAALVGVTQTPELYQVGINYVGVSDLRLATRWVPSEESLGRRLFYQQAIGRDSAWLRERSPVEHVASIRVPTLHAYGKNDPRVDFSHWEALEKALKKNGKPYEVVIEEREGHGFEKEAAALRFYSAVEKFLAKHLPVAE